MPEEEKFKVGVIIGLHGLAGVLKVRPGTNNPSLLIDLATVTVVTGKNEQLNCSVQSLRIDKGNLLLGLAEIADRTAAEAFMGSEIYTDRSQVAALDENEFWTGDLVGLEVYTTGGVHVGTVCDIINGAGDLLEIRKAGGTADDTALVPFVKALVPVVDIEGGRIEITDLPGLID